MTQNSFILCFGGFTKLFQADVELEGRPKLRWLDDIEADIKTLAIKRWRLTGKNGW
jgi:hypothetical protein